MVFMGPKGFSCTGLHRDFFLSSEIVYDGHWRLFLSYGIQGHYCIAQRPVYMGPKGFSISDESRLLSFSQVINDESHALTL